MHRDSADFLGAAIARRETAADLEREIIERVLEDEAGNKIRAAQLVYYPGARSAWQSGLREAVGQAARYAKSQKLASATLALFVPVSDEEVLRKLSGEEVIDGVRVITVAIGWT